MNNNAEVGKRINEIRKRRGYTREKLSEMAEISVQFIGYIEKGRKSMTIATLRRVAAALNVTTDYIVNGSETFSDNTQINTILASLPQQYRSQAEKLLTVFVETINQKNSP
ncbi:MAG: helix-turn-helix domain-containing protein [Oscillospiraceae bacterium]|nr:helix-turn-helix domain-containing protein [Oscillospiraceae bacterium]